jgi:GNAT superfamily N-acetyltransferase
MMIVCDLSSNVDKNNVFKAFQIGFSDYLIKFNFTLETFLDRFFCSEGNSLNHSFIALDGDEPIGVILGGIKVYEGIKTMRCGTLAIHPEYRGKGISNALFELHKRVAINEGCKQLYLEVIVGNDRAIGFYKKLGYEKVYDLSYFTLDNVSDLMSSSMQKIELLTLNKADFVQFFRTSNYSHINWQNDLEAIEKVPGTAFYGALINNKIIGALAMNISGRINYLYVRNEHRNKHIATSILIHTLKQNHPQKLTISFSNNSLLEGFVKRIGFKRDNIAQYEMYLTL